MLYILVAWVCLFCAVVLAWVWLQSHTYLRPMHPDAKSQTQSDRVVLTTIAGLLVLSVLLLVLHFVVPLAEAAADAEWTKLANTTLERHSMNASARYTDI